MNYNFERKIWCVLNLPRCVAVMLMMILCSSAYASADDRKVTIDVTRERMGNVLNAIGKQTGYSFFYSTELLDDCEPVTYKAVAQPLDIVLNQLLLPYGLDYTINKKQIVLSKKMEATTKLQVGQEVTVTGNVTDNEGEPLIGVSVLCSDGSKGVITDFDGNYNIKVPVGSSLTFSYVGCSPVKKKIESASPLDIVMSPNDNMLNEVVVVGYGTQKKVNLTGAVSVIDGKDLEGRSANNMTQLLQGTVPNMNIKLSGGRPGESGSINIRGVQTLSGSSSGMNPLTLIDGVEGDINAVNPNDVESISVLRDASASAIYGARAAFGVILVTTKIGKSGKSTISYSGSYSFGGPTVSRDYETRGYYSAAINDMFFKSYAGINYTTYDDEDYYELWIRRNDKTEHPDRPWVMVKDGTYRYYGNTDWWHYLYDESRPTWDQNISVQGGTDKVNYYISGGYHSQDGVMAHNTDRFTKYDFRTKVSAEITSWLRLNNNTSYHNQAYTYNLPMAANSFIDNADVHLLASDVPVNPDGTAIYIPSSHSGGYSLANGVIAAMLNGNNRSKDRNSTFSTTFEALINPINHLNITANYTYLTYNLWNQNRKSQFEYSKVPGEIITADIKGISENSLYRTNTESYYHAANAFATYDNGWRGNNIKVTAGVNYERRHYQYTSIYRDGVVNDKLDDFNLATGDIIELHGGQDAYALFGAFFRANYDYNGRYLAEFCGRYDGSSRFKRHHRYGFFPSGSLGWRFSEENFFQNMRQWWNNGKLRISYGQLGNQAGVGYYDYLQTITTGSLLSYTFDGLSSATSSSVSAPNAGDLTWEKVITYNLGLDLGFFNNRLSFTGDIYIRDTNDMLCASQDLPGVYGAAAPMTNAANLRTKGWEILLEWKDGFNLGNNRFNYQIMASLADNTSKVRKYYNPQKILGTPYVGQELGEIWGFKTDGYFATDEEAANYEVDQAYVNNLLNGAALDPGLHAGDLKYVDLDGDGKILPTQTRDDIKDMVKIGNALPRYTYSFRLSAQYIGFDVSAFFQGVGKQDWYPGHETQLYWGPYSRPYVSFVPKDFLKDVWSEENPNAKFPRPRGYVAMNNDRELSRINDRYLESVAYLRLKNLTVGYTLPRKWLNAIYFTNLRVYFSGENLFCCTPLRSRYIDPEQAGSTTTWRYTTDTNVRASYPYYKLYTFGVQATF